MTQIVQERSDKLRVKVVKDQTYSLDQERLFLKQLKEVVGDEMSIEMEYLDCRMLCELKMKKYIPLVISGDKGNVAAN